MRWCARNALGWLGLAAMLLGMLAADARAQGIAGPIKEFRLPEYDDNGKLKSEILGEEAKMQPDGKIKITNLHLRMYKAGVLEATIWAAECLFDRNEKTAVSDTAVRLEKGRMTVSGIGLRWNGDQQHIEILSSVRVVLKDTKVWAKQEKR